MLLGDAKARAADNRKELYRGRRCTGGQALTIARLWARPAATAMASVRPAGTVA